ncbi:MAG TPA: phosphopyruvate hydratase [Actinomycetota bacterium]|nr:phosphopyruvate hydratase [Actinomycetota bacterium]
MERAGGIAVSAIERVWAWEALDSRGTPTVACEVVLATGARGQAIVPSGASTGTYEAHELRDGGDRYGGRGVRTAVGNVNGPLAASVHGLDAADQEAVDAALRAADGTPNLGTLGANAVLAVSVASALAAAEDAGEPLWRRLGDPLIPMPMVNILSGGAHAARAVDVQDFLVVPVGAHSFAEAIEWAWRVRRATAELCAERGLVSALIADEGGLGPPLGSNREALDLLASGIERAGLEPGSQAAIAIDVAATQFHDAGRYTLAAEERVLDAGELVSMLEGWCDAHPIVSIEDPLADDDWEGWREATVRLGSRVQLLGDDLFVTDLARLETGIGSATANSVLVKPNQTGTVSGAASVVRRCAEAGYAAVVSARSGETEDSWMSDMAVGWGAGQIKVGSTMRSERTAKWNRVLRIEAELGEAARFAGRTVIGGRHVAV